MIGATRGEFIEAMAVCFRRSFSVASGRGAFSDQRNEAARQFSMDLDGVDQSIFRSDDFHLRVDAINPLKPLAI